MSTIEQFLQIVDRFAAAHGISDATLSTRLFNDGKRVAAIREGRDVGARRIDRALLYMVERWPPGAEWPASVPRPALVRTDPPQPMEAAQ